MAKATLNKVEVTPPVHKETVTLELSKKEAAALLCLWESSAWFPIGLEILRHTLGRGAGGVVDEFAMTDRKYSDYYNTLTESARKWIESLSDEH